MAPPTPTKLMTAEEFYEYAHRPENIGKNLELDRGEVVELVSRPKKLHGFVCGNVAGILRNFAIERGKGYPCSNDTGLIVERDPDTIRGPDVIFFEDDQDADTMDEEYPATIPPLVVEVLSPNDAAIELNRRVSQYRRRGIPLIWVVDPELRIVTVYRPGHDPRILEETDELTGEEVLSDFRCRVAEFFALPGKPSSSPATSPQSTPSKPPRKNKPGNKSPKHNR